MIPIPVHLSIFFAQVCLTYRIYRIKRPVGFPCYEKGRYLEPKM